MANRLIEAMRRGEKAAIWDGLNHAGAIYRMNGISFYVLSGLEDAEMVERIKELKRDDVALDGYSVSDFACAALELLGIDGYTGDSVRVKNLIGSEFEFMK